jgi:hypothetical protein
MSKMSFIFGTGQAQLTVQITRGLPLLAEVFSDPVSQLATGYKVMIDYLNSSTLYERTKVPRN